MLGHLGFVPGVCRRGLADSLLSASPTPFLCFGGCSYRRPTRAVGHLESWIDSNRVAGALRPDPGLVGWPRLQRLLGGFGALRAPLGLDREPALRMRR